MDYFPLFFDVYLKPVVVFGNGEDALRKVRLLLRTTADLYVVAEEPPGWPGEVLARLTVIQNLDEFDQTLSQVSFVIIAEDSNKRRDAALNWARTRGKNVNVVDQKGLSDFIIPSFLDRGKFVAAFSSSGAAPVLVRTIRAELERRVPEMAEAIFQIAAGARAAVAIRYEKAADRRAYWERIASSVFHSEDLQTEQDVHRCFIDAFIDASPQRAPSVSWIKLPASQRAEDITLGEYRLLQTCDAVVCYGKIPDSIQDLVRRDAERILVTEPVSHSLILQELASRDHLEHIVAILCD